MIDTHAHIYSEQFDSDRQAVIQAARTAGVERLLLPNVDSSTVSALHQAEADNPGYCLAMMGLHPTSVDAGYEKELEQVKKWLDQRAYTAVGEIGIDLYWDKTHLEAQKKAFEQQIIWAKELALPVVIHCRDAFPVVFELVEKHLDDDLRGVFHSFTGEAEDARRILHYPNFMMGINGVVTFKNTNLREVLAEVPLDQLVLETDAPYLAPVPHRGRRNEPAYLEKVAEALSGVYEMPVEGVIARTSENARRMFKL